MSVCVQRIKEINTIFSNLVVKETMNFCSLRFIFQSIVVLFWILEYLLFIIFGILFLFVSQALHDSEKRGLWDRMSDTYVYIKKKLGGVIINVSKFTIKLIFSFANFHDFRPQIRKIIKTIIVILKPTKLNTLSGEKS